jgi:hypothetical protein
MVFAYSQHKGIEVKLINNGDDCVVFMESGNAVWFMEGLDEWFTEMGFTMVAEEPVYEIEQIVFCQASPIWTPQGYVMVRNPHTALAKDSMTIVTIDNEKAYRMYLGNRGMCGEMCSGGILIFQTLYKRMTDSGIPSSKGYNSQRAMQDGLYYQARGMSRQGISKVHPKTRASFYIGFGITPAEQITLERYLGRLPFTYGKPVAIHSRDKAIAFGLPKAFAYPDQDKAK